MNSDTASFYYATYFEEIFDGQESTEIAPAFAEEMEQFPQLSYVPYYLLIGCLHKITFEQALAVYDFSTDGPSKRGSKSTCRTTRASFSCAST